MVERKEYLNVGDQFNELKVLVLGVEIVDDDDDDDDAVEPQTLVLKAAHIHQADRYFNHTTSREETNN